MDYYVIRSKKGMDEFCEQLKHKSLPLKIATQEVFPLRSLEANAYYFGVILKYIGDETGHSIDEIHEAYKLKFRYTQEFRYNPRTKKMQFYTGVGSTIVDEYAFYDYIFRVRADAEISLGIIIPMPNETFIRELNFNHDRIKTQRI